MIKTPEDVKPMARIDIAVDLAKGEAYARVDDNPVYTQYFSNNEDIEQIKLAIMLCTAHGLGLMGGFLLSTETGCKSVMMSPFARYIGKMEPKGD